MKKIYEKLEELTRILVSHPVKIELKQEAHTFSLFCSDLINKYELICLITGFNVASALGRRVWL